ncbi:abhydrolase domain containing 13-like protein Bem46 isoform X1 [Rhodnius prolixus]
MNIKLESLKFLPLIAIIILKCWKLFCVCLLFFLVIYWIFGGFMAIAVLFIALGFCFYMIQDHLLFHPDDNNSQSRMFVQTPSSIWLPFENIFIKSLDGTLIHLYFIRQEEPVASKAPTVVFFHGNAGNMGHRLQNAAGLFSSLHCNILMVEYRGYGQSKGYPSENGIYMDAQAALDFLAARPDVNQTQIVVFGRSLGGAVAIDLAARAEYASRIWCVIVENTFTSIPDMTAALFNYNWLRYVPLFAYKNKFLSKEKIGSVTSPILFVSGQTDSLVPPKMMSELYRLCGSTSKHFVPFPSGGHNDTWTCPEYYPCFESFLTSVKDHMPSSPPICQLRGVASVV